MHNHRTNYAPAQELKSRTTKALGIFNVTIWLVILPMVSRFN